MCPDCAHFCHTLGPVYQKAGQVHDHTPEDFFSSLQMEAYSFKYLYRNYSDLNNCYPSPISLTFLKHRTSSFVRSYIFAQVRAFAQAVLTAWNLGSSHLLANWCPGYFSSISPCPGRLPRPLFFNQFKWGSPVSSIPTWAQSHSSIAHTGLSLLLYIF